MNSQRDDLTSLPLSVHAVDSHTRINITEEAEAEGEIAAVYQYFVTRWDDVMCLAF